MSVGNIILDYICLLQFQETPAHDSVKILECSDPTNTGGNGSMCFHFRYIRQGEKTAMTKGEPFLSAKETLACAIVVTCFCFIYILVSLSGAYSHESPFFTSWGFVLALAIPSLSWLEFARRNIKLS
jgi:hypothetical protein